MPVLMQRRGPVTTIVLARPQVANAVDRRTAQELADAFRAFDTDEDALAAVLCGEGQNFCGGADLKQIAAGDPNRIEPDGDGPMGPTRMLLTACASAPRGGAARNRVVPSGTCRAAAQQLALELTRYPQDCLRHDRRSAYEGVELPFHAAIENELQHGLASLRAGGAAGAARFAGGEGRHGAF